MVKIEQNAYYSARPSVVIRLPKAERHFQLFETKRTWFLCERFQNN